MKQISPDTGVIFDNPAHVRHVTLSVVRELYPPNDSVHFYQEDGSWSRCDLDVTRRNPVGEPSLRSHESKGVPL